ncbi:hypothetical protein D5086_013862 [Populus alba]|uniref:Uncharacterized protein n=1 Tax=Populus alba TaxID=43335 RepID=A0ACC4C6P7_POPAL
MEACDADFEFNAETLTWTFPISAVLWRQIEKEMCRGRAKACIITVVSSSEKEKGNRVFFSLVLIESNRGDLSIRFCKLRTNSL